MANPQLDDGYTRIANELMEALARTALTVYEYKTLLFILRNIYGWNGRKEWKIKKWNEFEQIGIPSTCIKRTLLMLSERQIIKIEGKTISFLKDYDLWQNIDTAKYYSKEKVISPDKSKVISPDKSKVISPDKSELSHQISQVISPDKFSNFENGNETIHNNGLDDVSYSSKTILKKDIKKEEKYKESSSSSKDIVVQGEDEDELKNKKAKKILSKQFGDISCFLYEDLVKIGGFEEEQIKTVAENARRQKVHFRNLSTWIMRGLDEYEEKYKKKEEKPISTSEVTAVRVAKNPPMNYATAYQELSSVKNFIDIDSFIENGFIPDRQYGNIIVICRDMFKHLEMFPGLESEYEKAYPGRLDVMRDMLEYISDREKEAEVSND
jgi:phage replication O-like protein O